MKIAKHDSKDEIQFGDNIENRSPASTHLMELFTGSSDHTTNTQPEKLDLRLTDQSSPSLNDILNDLLQHGHPTNPRFFHTKSKIYSFTLNPRFQIITHSTHWLSLYEKRNQYLRKADLCGRFASFCFIFHLF